MSETGQSEKSERSTGGAALPPTSDIALHCANGRFVPEAAAPSVAFAATSAARRWIGGEQTCCACGIHCCNFQQLRQTLNFNLGDTDDRPENCALCCIITASYNCRTVHCPPLRQMRAQAD